MGGTPHRLGRNFRTLSWHEEANFSNGSQGWNMVTTQVEKGDPIWATGIPRSAGASFIPCHRHGCVGWRFEGLVHHLEWPACGFSGGHCHCDARCSRSQKSAGRDSKLPCICKSHRLTRATCSFLPKSLSRLPLDVRHVDPELMQRGFNCYGFTRAKDRTDS